MERQPHRTDLHAGNPAHTVALSGPASFIPALRSSPPLSKNTSVRQILHGPRERKTSGASPDGTRSPPERGGRRLRATQESEAFMYRHWVSAALLVMMGSAAGASCTAGDDSPAR